MTEEPVISPPKTPLLGWLNSLSPQAVFVLIAGIFAIAMAIITPPIEVPDELAHWLRVYQLSEGTMIAEGYGGVAVRSIVRYSAPPWSLVPAHPEVKTPVRLLYDQFKVPLNPDQWFIGRYPNTALYSIVPYAPQTLAMLIARKLVLPPIALLYIGRIGTVLGYMLIGWSTIRITPILKWPACLALTHPMALFLAGSLSADPMTTALVFLACALALRCILSPVALGSGTIVGLAAAMVAVALCKSAYVPVVFLVLAVPRDKWGPGARQWLIPMTIIALALGAVAAWSALSQATHVREIADTPAEQLHWVLYHPGRYAGIVRRTLFNQGAVWFHSIGDLGWLDTPLAPSVTYFLYFAILWVLLAYDEPVLLPLWPRFVAGFAFLACIGLVITSNYLVWNKVGAPQIDGLQGRYLLPCAVPLFMVLRRRGTYPVQPKWMLAMIGAVAIYTVWVLVARYYLPVDILDRTFASK